MPTWTSTKKSTTKDVLALLKRLQKEDIAGLVVDLRRNGGGSLEEAISLDRALPEIGPDRANQRLQRKHRRLERSRSGHRLRWSAGRFDQPAKRVGERDFRRCAAGLRPRLIVGDKNTFGKGTVQTILEIGRFTSLLGSRSQEDGALKLTIQKFYRVAGGSTQLQGVASDIVVPSLSDLPEFGEGALKNCAALRRGAESEVYQVGGYASACSSKN